MKPSLSTIRRYIVTLARQRTTNPTVDIIEGKDLTYIYLKFPEGPNGFNIACDVRAILRKHFAYVHMSGAEVDISFHQRICIYHVRGLRDHTHTHNQTQTQSAA